MKTAFNILPVKIATVPLHLLVEVGDYGMSFLWFTKAPYAVKGVVIHNFTGKQLHSEIANEIGNILRSAPVYSDPVASTTICYDFKESLLIPASYHDNSANESMLHLVHGTGSESSYKTEPVSEGKIYNVYAVHKKIEDVLLRQYPSASVHHSTNFELRKIEPGSNYLHCIFFHNSVKVFIFKGDMLQLVQQFSYSIPVDASYHLLNCCEQHQLDPSETRLMLSGMIDEKSKLYSDLHRYFLNIEFEKPDSEIDHHERIKFYPSHFFSHLTALASCVS